MNTERPNWQIRRRIIYITLLFCASIIVYVTTNHVDSRLNETLANGAFFLAGSVVGSYIFGATWDDKKRR